MVANSGDKDEHISFHICNLFPAFSALYSRLKQMGADGYEALVFDVQTRKHTNADRTNYKVCS